jgi:hypothetical protein
MNQLQIFMPPPTNWQDFQILIAEVARAKYVSNSVQEIGRQGQRQDGVDIYATDLLDKHIGIQCKETKRSGLSTTIIDEEADKASIFSPSLDLFIVATTQRIDVNIQNHVNQINNSRKYQFKIQVWFWDDINREINRSQAVMSSCYKTFLEQFGAEEIKNHLSGIRLAFDRPAFKDDFLHERHYGDFEDALVDTKAMLKTGFLYDRRTRNLVGQIIPSSMVGDTDYQDFLQNVEKSLEKIYQGFLRDKRATVNNPKQLEERTGDYNISRRKLIEIINRRLQNAGMPCIKIAY